MFHLVKIKTIKKNKNNLSVFSTVKTENIKNM